MENNTVKITGKIMETPEYLLTSPDRRKIYKSTIEVMRTSGNMDVIPIQVPEQIVQEIRDNVGGRITIFGEYRSYNEKDGRRKHTRANEHRRLYCGGMTNGENRRNMDGMDTKG